MADGTLKRLKAGVHGPTPPKAPKVTEVGEAAMTQSRSRPAWAEIDLAAVTHNARVLSNLVRPARLCAVVKAQGYGHGAVAVARAALAGGALGLAVALVDEGVELRLHKVHGPILLLSECGPEAVDAAMAYGLTPTVYSAEGIGQFAQAARMLGQRTSVHIKVDTGMHRVGAAPAEVPALLRAIADDPLLRFEGLWTHFPVADGESAEDRSFTLRQLALFNGAIDEMAREDIHPDVIHAANTAGAILYPQARYGMVRCGIGLYGYLPGAAVDAAFAAASGGEVLRPALSLAGPGGLGAVPWPRENGPPTGASGRCRSDPWWPRCLSATPTGCRGRSSPQAPACSSAGSGGRLAGMVTMDQIMVDCEEDGSVRPGDEVVLLGRQGDEEITADEWADLLGTISYEILCGIGPRVPRVVVNAPEPTGGSITPPIP